MCNLMNERTIVKKIKRKMITYNERHNAWHNVIMIGKNERIDKLGKARE